MDYDVIHLEDQQKMETNVDGWTAYVTYRIFDGYFDIIHTIVPPPIEGRGIAAALVKHAYTFAREKNCAPLEHVPTQLYG